MDKYIKIRLGKTKIAVARQAPGGWFNIVSTHDSEAMCELTLDALLTSHRRAEAWAAESAKAPQSPRPSGWGRSK